MTKLLNRPIPITTFFEYLIAIAVVLNTRSVYLHIENNSNNLFTFAVLMLLIFGCLGTIICQGKMNNNCIFNCIKTVLILFVYISIYIIIRPLDLVADVFYLLSFCIIATYFYLACSKTTVPSILIKYANIIIFIALYSTLMWFVCTKCGLISPSGTLLSTWSGDKINNYFWIYFETQNIRNTSIFIEAPMSSLHFSVALLLELFILRRKNNKKTVVRIFILIIAIYSTSSMTGYALVVSSLIAKFLLVRFKHTIINEVKIIIIPILAVLGIVVCYKFYMTRMATMSGTTRMNDFLENFKIWTENFLFGIGGGTIKSSNSWGVILAERGIYLGSLFIYCFIKAIKNSITNRNFNYLFFVIFFLYLFIFTVIPYTYLSMLVLLCFAKVNLSSTVKPRVNYNCEVFSAKNSIKS